MVYPRFCFDNFLLVFIFGITYDLNYLTLVGNKHDIFYLWRPILKDPKDDHVLELAVKSNSQFISYP